MAFKMNGMNFGVGAESSEPTMPKEIQPDPPMLKNGKSADTYGGMLPEVKLVGKKNENAEKKDNKSSKWSKNQAGYDVKTTERKNLFGRDRKVEKYYDPKTGKKLGKQVTVDRGKNDPRAKKKKIKKVNPGLTQSGGVGKIRLKENPWESGGEAINRQERAFDLKDTNVTKNKKGQPEIPKYKTAFDDMENRTVDGVTKKYNPRNKMYYEDSDKGLELFEGDSEGWWDEQAKKTSNPKLEKQDQSYGRKYESSSKYKKPSSVLKKRGFKMNSPLKNYKKGYYGE